MKNVNISRLVCAIAILFSVASCSKKNDTGYNGANGAASVTAITDMINEQGSNPDEASVTENERLVLTRNTGSTGHYVYTESNETGANRILVFKVKNNGDLEEKGSVVSGGEGTGKGLGSQGALAVDKKHEWLYAVNAGSNSISVFRIQDNGSLTLASTRSSSGMQPVSLSIHDNLLYVLNRGTDNIHGFTISKDGMLIDIAASTQSLSAKMVDAPQVSISPDGRWVIVTEKATNIIGTFKINHDGTVNAGTFTTSAGPTPFGFEFARDRYMIVSNAVGGQAGAGSASSHRILGNGTAKAVNGAVGNQQGAPCWVATTKYGRFAFVTNTASNSISSYYVAEWGALYLVNSVAAKTVGGPLDVVVSGNNCHVYVLTGGERTIQGFKRKLIGGLEPGYTSSVLPVSTTGLATY